MAAMADSILRVRDMTSGDLASAHALSRQMQWPHRIEDWAFLLSIGEGVVVEDGDAIVGTAMGWPYGPASACLGMVIVDSGRQGQGIGRKLMNAVIEKLGERTILLNATAEGLPLYKSLGFEPVGTIHQHQGAAFSVPIANVGPDERIRPMGKGDQPAIAELDRKATGLERGALIAELLRAKAKGVVLVRNGEAIGFSFFRRFGRGYSIGPTVAPDQQGAKALISHWLGSQSGMFMRLDVPGDTELSPWLEELGIADVGTVTTMARGTPAPRDAAVRTFSIITQALG